MSEQQSPEKTADPFGDTNVASMEDILASIRSMIADDEGPGEPELAAPPPIAEVVDDPVDATPESIVVETPDVQVEPPADPVGIQSISTDMLDIDSLFEGEDLALDVDLAPREDVAPQEDAPEAEFPVDLPGEEDMDLVKTLMAELSEAPEEAVLEPLAVEAPVEAPVQSVVAEDEVLELDEGWFSGELTIPEAVENAPVVTADALETQDEPDTTSMLDEILLGSLETEEALNAAETSDPEPVEAATADDETESDTDTSNVVSLSDIAAMAEREAEDLAAAPAAVDYPSALEEGAPDIETPAEVQTAGEFAHDIMDDLAAMDDLTAPEPEPEAVEPAVEETEPTPPASDTEAELAQALEEEVMARTAPLEEIIDDEVEVEASNAFAQLNRLVEEKSVVEERGPRIGDLVQEALKPMLKEWLDENLKGIVERAVQKEVKRISSGK